MADRRSLFMYQQVVMGSAAFVCLCYEQHTELYPALLSDSLEVLCDLGPDLAVPFRELFIRWQPVKVDALRGEPQARTADRFELLRGAERQCPEPCAGRLVILLRGA